MASTDQILRFTSLKTNSKSCRKLMVGFNESFPINHGPNFFQGTFLHFQGGGCTLSNCRVKILRLPTIQSCLCCLLAWLHKIRQLTFNRFFPYQPIHLLLRPHWEQLPSAWPPATPCLRDLRDLVDEKWLMVAKVTSSNMVHQFRGSKRKKSIPTEKLHLHVLM